MGSPAGIETYKTGRQLLEKLYDCIALQRLLYDDFTSFLDGVNLKYNLRQIDAYGGNLF